MSLFGKILALFNIFGAIGLVVMASMDYGKRQAWAYNRLRHQIILTGLPLDDKELAPNESRIAGLFGDDSLGQIFRPVGGTPVSTQLQEVNRVKDQLDGRLNKVAADKRAQSHLYARILLPLTDSHLEREQYLACRWHLATPASLATFKKRFVDAFAEAIKLPDPADPKPKSFEEAFRDAARAQGGQPAEAFTTLLVKTLPNDRAKAKGVDIAKEFDAALEAQRKQLETRYGDLFAVAKNGPAPEGVKKKASDADNQEAVAKNYTEEQKQLQADKRRLVEAQKAFIARLLFGLCLVQAEAAVDANPALGPRLVGVARDTAAFGQGLIDTDTYRKMVLRVHIICGIRASLNAISARAVVLRKLADYLEGTVAQERQLFVGDHSALVEEIRQRAYLLQQELAHKAESERKLTVQEEQVKKRKFDVNLAEMEYAALRAKTAESMAALRKVSQDLLNDRVKARDLIRLAEESEKTIRALEKQIRQLESER